MFRPVHNLLKCAFKTSPVLSRCVCGIRMYCSLNSLESGYRDKIIQKRYYRKELSCPPITVTSPELLLYWIMNGKTVFVMLLTSKESTQGVHFVTTNVFPLPTRYLQNIQNLRLSGIQS